MLSRIHLSFSFRRFHAPTQLKSYHCLFSKNNFERRTILKKISESVHLSCARSPALITISIFYSTKSKVQCIPAICWINSQFFSKRSYGRSHNNTEELCKKYHSRMVWISNLDNPQVLKSVIKIYF